jgi:DNA repair exonuclease SbcCD ATPase subunit
MNIKQIKISNILGLKELEFNAGKFVEISGKNGIGKTSVIEAIKSGLKGGSTAQLLHNGAEKGEIVIVLDDGMEIRKTISNSNAKLDVSKNGHKISKPQSLLDELADLLSANPVQFLTADKKDRLNILLEALPLELPKTEIETTLKNNEININVPSGHALQVISSVHKEIYDERTYNNRAAKEKSSAINQLKDAINDIDFEPAEVEIKIAELAAKETQMRAKKDEYDTEINDNYTHSIDDATEQYQDSLKIIQDVFENAKKQAAEHKQKKKDELNRHFTEKMGELTSELATLREKQKQAGSLQKTKELIEQYKKEQSNFEMKSSNLTAALDYLKYTKESLLQDLPIQGLEIIDGEIYLNDVTFDKLNTAKQIEVAIEIAKLRAKDLKLICVDGLERFDTDNYNEFKKQALASDLQMIVTKVSNDEQLAIGSFE